MVETYTSTDFPTHQKFFRPQGYTSKMVSLEKKFSYSDYLEAHKWLDAIFYNGCTVNRNERTTPSICEQCGGLCCQIDQFTLKPKEFVDEGKPLPLMVWNENIYFQDTEFLSDPTGNLICKRTDPINCKNKMIICKAHPFYPAKIHLLEEKCDYAININSYDEHRRLCARIEYEEWQLQELSYFYQWLYGNFPENRLVYILYSLLHLDGSTILDSQVLDIFQQGVDCSSNIVFQP